MIDLLSILMISFQPLQVDVRFWVKKDDLALFPLLADSAPGCEAMPRLFRLENGFPGVCGPSRPVNRMFPRSELIKGQPHRFPGTGRIHGKIEHMPDEIQEMKG
jgi:hypothetical protein